MQTKITKIERDKPELIEIHCHTISDEVREIVAFVTDIFYIEAVDNKCFIYTESKVYETKQKLYELEEILKEKYFLRTAKSMILNLMKVRAIKPSLNSRFIAELYSGEQVVISRKYVSALKKALQGENGNDG